jgi:carboxymethylenebutenolidase
MTSTADWLEVSTADGPMRAYRVRPAARITPPAAVVVLQEAFGVNDHIQDVARRIAAEGYLALAPDLFHRSGGAVVDYTDHAAAMELIGALGRGQIDCDAASVLGYLEDVEGIPRQRTGIIGFCFGGRAAFTAATSAPGLAGTVVFYGPGIAAGPHAVLDRVPTITGPVLLLAGDQDPTIPAGHIRAIRSACGPAGVDLRVQIFAGAGHAFHCDARPAMYRPDAASVAWKETVTFLAATAAAGQP